MEFIKKHQKFIKFLFVGVLNTIFGYSVFAFLIFLKIHYTFAVIISTTLGVLFNFKTTGKIVFDNSKNSLLFKFVGVYIIVCLVNIAFLRVFEFLKFNMYLAGAVLILPMAIISFTLSKNFVFNSIHKD